VCARADQGVAAGEEKCSCSRHPACRQTVSQRHPHWAARPRDALRGGGELFKKGRTFLKEIWAENRIYILVGTLLD
jgi:hypothetical protein